MHGQRKTGSAFFVGPDRIKSNRNKRVRTHEECNYIIATSYRVSSDSVRIYALVVKILQQIYASNERTAHVLRK